MSLSRHVVAAAASVGLLGLLSACGGPAATPTIQPTSTPTQRSSPAPAHVISDYHLFVHCGVQGFQYVDGWYQATWSTASDQWNWVVETGTLTIHGDGTADFVSTQREPDAMPRPTGPAQVLKAHFVLNPAGFTGEPCA